MFSIDKRNNITLDAGDTGVINFSLCGCNDKLKDEDIVVFHNGDNQTVTVRTFTNGVARIEIPEKEGSFKGRYCIKVQMKDGRKSTVIEGKFERKDDC